MKKSSLILSSLLMVAAPLSAFADNIPTPPGTVSVPVPHATSQSPGVTGDANAPETKVPNQMDIQVRDQLKAGKEAAERNGVDSSVTQTNSSMINGQASTTARPPQEENEKLGGTPFDYAHIPHDHAQTIPDSLKEPLDTKKLNTPISSDLKAKEIARNNSLVTANAKILSKTPLTHTRDRNLRFVQVTVKNDSPEVALIHGDIAQANIAGALKTATSARYVGEVASPKLGLSGRIATGVVTAGTFGFAGPLFYENMTPEQHAKRYLGTAIGNDGSRHEIESDRFGLRVLLPGDETVGWLAFDCANETQMTNLVIPVNYSKSTLPSGSLVIPVSQQPADGSASKPFTPVTVQPLSPSAAAAVVNQPPAK